MNRAEVLAELRSVIDDTVAPYAWSDTRLMRFLSLGQTQFCRDTGFFRDSTTYHITTEAGVSTYDLAPEIIEVLSIDYPDAPTIPGLFDVSSPFGWMNRDTGKITLTPTPAAVVTINLQVWRAALQSFDHTTTNGAYDGSLEIPEDFHLAPVEWAAAKCFGDHDRERQDPVKAADHLANYRALAKEGKLAFRRTHGERVNVIPNLSYVV